jgi:rubrerythrin
VFSKENSQLSHLSLRLLKSVIRMVKNRQNQTSKIVRKYQDAIFLICKSCFWCASWILTDYNYSEQCPTCSSIKMESIPISETESYL